MLFPEIKPTVKSEFEELSDNGQSLGYRILDFWKWSMSDIMSNASRGLFAEFIVGTAIGFEKSVRNEWADFDLTADNGRIRIEVKSASYIQSWEQKKLSDIVFSIKAPKATNTRLSDVYVFCLLKHTDQSTIDPLKMEQWEFYVVPTKTIDGYERSKTHISLNSLKKIATPIKYQDLRDKILMYDNL